MLKIYVKSNCAGSKKAEELLKKLEVPYERINLSYQPIIEEDVYEMMSLSNSYLDIINLNSSYFGDDEEFKKDFISKTKKEVVSEVLRNPNLLSFPIAMQYDSIKTPKVLIVGFTTSEWTRLENEPKFYNYYENVNKKYVFKSCCFFDEVLNDDINILYKTSK